MANTDPMPAKARPAQTLRGDLSTTVFTAVSATVFLILIGCVAAAALLFSQGL